MKIELSTHYEPSLQDKERECPKISNGFSENVISALGLCGKLEQNGANHEDLWKQAVEQ